MAARRRHRPGLVVLTSDLCYSKENLDKDILPSIGLVLLDRYHYVKGAVEREGGDVIFAHDPEVFKAHKQSPEYYE